LVDSWRAALMGPRFQHPLSNRAGQFLAHGLTMVLGAWRARSDTDTAAMLPAGRHPRGSVQTSHESGRYRAAWHTTGAGVAVLALCFPGWWPSRACPRAYPLHRHDQSRVPSLQRLITAFSGTTNPSDSRSTPRAFGFRLIRPVFARRGLPRRASRVPHFSFETCRRQYPGEAQCSFQNKSTVHRLRRDMTGSAFPNTFRLII
jgi:hypothetical protein